jgi:flagellum-specific ATP synthase
MKTISFEKYHLRLQAVDPLEYGGRVSKIVGLTVEASGPASKIGDICRIYAMNMEKYIPSEVVGFRITM